MSIFILLSSEFCAPCDNCIPHGVSFIVTNKPFVTVHRLAKWVFQQSSRTEMCKGHLKVTHHGLRSPLQACTKGECVAYLWSVGVVEEGRVSWKSLRRGGEGVIGVEGSEATSHRLFLLRFAKSLSLDVRPLSSHRPPRGMRHVTGGIVGAGTVCR